MLSNGGCSVSRLSAVANGPSDQKERSEYVIELVGMASHALRPSLLSRDPNHNPLTPFRHRSLRQKYKIRVNSLLSLLTEYLPKYSIMNAAELLSNSLSPGMYPRSTFICAHTLSNASMSLMACLLSFFRRAYPSGCNRATGVSRKRQLCMYPPKFLSLSFTDNFTLFAYSPRT